MVPQDRCQPAHGRPAGVNRPQIGSHVPSLAVYRMAHRAPLSPEKQLRAFFRDAHHVQRVPGHRRAVLGDQVGHQDPYGDKGRDDPKQELSRSTQRDHTLHLSTSRSKTPNLPRGEVWVTKDPFTAETRRRGEDGESVSPETHGSALILGDRKSTRLNSSHL